MTKEYFCFGDAHSNYETVLALLEQEGLVNGAGKRLRPEVTVVSIGDLANCVISSRDADLKCLSLVGPVVDKLILGNHESPYYGLDKFSGFFFFPEISEKIADLANDNLITPCLEVNGIFISHAGLTNSIAAGQYKFETAKDAFSFLYEEFFTHPKRPIFNHVGYSRGGFGEGGILWSDWSESKYSKFIQICGHTANPKGIRMKVGKHSNTFVEMDSDNRLFQELVPRNERLEYSSYCIDIACQLHVWEGGESIHSKDQIAGVWIRDDELEFVVYNKESG